MKRFIPALALLLFLPQVSLAADTSKTVANDPATPAQRMSLWLNGLQTFADSRETLSPKLAELLTGMVDQAEERLFVGEPGVEERAILTQQMAALRFQLPCEEYSELVSMLDGLRAWFDKNSMVAAESCGTTCNCNSDSQCATNQGYSCASVTCTNQAGGTNWGVCKRI